MANILGVIMVRYSQEISESSFPNLGYTPVDWLVNGQAMRVVPRVAHRTHVLSAMRPTRLQSLRSWG